MKIYLAAPLHDTDDQKWIYLVSEELRKGGLEIYSPLEHGVWEDLLKMFDGDVQKTREYCFVNDINAMQRADACIATFNRDRGPSEGMLWEMGWFYGANKPIYIINPNGWKYNIMPEVGATASFMSAKNLLLYLTKEDFK